MSQSRKRAMPPPSLDDPEIHPGDWVVLTENDPYLVGNHEQVQAAYRDGIPGRVAMKRWMALGIFEERALGKKSSYEVEVRFYMNQHKPFFFWIDVLKKVEPPTIARTT